jgi:hypothetical protein
MSHFPVFVEFVCVCVCVDVGARERAGFCVVSLAALRVGFSVFSEHLFVTDTISLTAGCMSRFSLFVECVCVFVWV